MSLSPASENVTFAEFEADLRSCELRRNGAKVKIPDQSFQILAILLERPGELVTREEIRTRLWPSDTFVDFDHGLNNAVNRLREALGDSAETHRFIETLPRRGYRFVSFVSGGSAKAEVVSTFTPPENHVVNTFPITSASTAITAHHRWLHGAMSLLVALALLIVLQLWLSPAPPPNRTFVLPPDGTTFSLIRDDGGSVTLSPDGRSLAFVAVDKEGTARVWVRPLGSLHAQPLEGTEGASFPFWAPDGQWIAFFSDATRTLKKVRLQGGPAVTLCAATHGRGGSWNRHGVIVFAPNTESSLYRVTESGGTPTQITNVNASIHTTHRWPRFLPDGRHFLYLAANHRGDSKDDGIYFGSLDAESPKLLVRGHADATYASGYLFFLVQDSMMAQRFDSSRGQLNGEPQPTKEKVLYDPSIWKAVFDASDHGVMAYQLGGRVNGTRLRWFDRSGSALGDVGEVGFHSPPRLSPNGRSLLAGRVRGFGSYGDLWVYDLARNVGTQVTFGTPDYYSGVWAHNSDRILVNEREEQHSSIYELDSGGAGSKRLFLNTGVNIAPIDLSADGQFFLYEQAPEPGDDHSKLWVFALNGHKTVEVRGDWKTRPQEARLSPDGSLLAYTSNESGPEEIYVVSVWASSSLRESAKGAVREKWRISASGGREPAWRRDGKELFYVAPDQTLMSVPLTGTGLQFVPGVGHPLFRPESAYAYDVSSDGNKFILSLAAPVERTAPITIVENWLSDFRR